MTHDNPEPARATCRPRVALTVCPPVAVSLLALSLLLSLGCTTGPSPTQRHAELEWEMRTRMPFWPPSAWNAWEAELAAALDLPQPSPPMFPDANTIEENAAADADSDADAVDQNAEQEDRS